MKVILIPRIISEICDQLRSEELKDRTISHYTFFVRNLRIKTICNLNYLLENTSDYFIPIESDYIKRVMNMMKTTSHIYSTLNDLIQETEYYDILDSNSDKLVINRFCGTYLCLD